MALVPPTVNVDGEEDFDALVADAWDKPWWRRYIRTLEARRTHQLNELIKGGLDQRQEDVIRGRVQELNFSINLDERAKALSTEKEKERRNG